MFTKPYIFGLAPGGVDDPKRPIAHRLGEAGQNTGNYLFTAAIHGLFPGRTPNGWGGAPAAIREAHDCVVVAAANWINPHINVAKFAEALDAIALPIIVVGLGAQAPIGGDLSRLPESTQKLISVLACRAVGVSVRGPFTKAVLALHGIADAVDTGCPSLLLAGPGPGRVAKRAATLTAPDQIAVHGTRHGFSADIFQPRPDAEANLRLYRAALRQGYDLVLQSEAGDMQLAGGRAPDSTMPEDGLAFLEAVYDVDAAAVRAYLARHARVFYQTAPWVSYLAEKRFVIGSRIHGAVAALLAGAPSLVLAHDSRTLEMAERLNIPHRRLTEVHDWSPPALDRLYQELDWAAFNAGLVAYRARFAQFFRDSGLALAAETLEAA